jgi:hypothetical protein
LPFDEEFLTIVDVVNFFNFAEAPTCDEAKAVLRLSTMNKLRLWSNFWQQNNAILMNAVVTSHLPVCLYSVQVGRWIDKSSAPDEQSPAPTEWWTIELEKVIRQDARTCRIMGPFRARYEKRSRTAKGLLLGVCFVAKGILRRNTFKGSMQKQA